MSGLVQDSDSVSYLRANHKIGDIVEVSVVEKYDSSVPVDRPLISLTVPSARPPQSFQSHFLSCLAGSAIGFENEFQPRFSNFSDSCQPKEGFFFGLDAKSQHQTHSWKWRKESFNPDFSHKMKPYKPTRRQGPKKQFQQEEAGKASPPFTYK